MEPINTPKTCSTSINGHSKKSKDVLQGAKNKKSEINLFDKQEKQMIKKDESYKPDQIEANESPHN